MIKYSILIVEDEFIPAQYMKKILNHSGHKIIGIADSMESATSYMGTQHIDLVLMDIKIKGDTDGIEVAKQFKSHQDTAILYTTAYTDDNFLNRAKDTNTIGYLVKPIQPNTLLSTIEIAMAKFIQNIQIVSEILLCENISFNMSKQLLNYENKEVLLSKDESDILAFLYNENNLSISYKELEDILHSNDVHTNTALRTIIWRLRKKLPTCISIENIYSYGYRLNCK